MVQTRTIEHTRPSVRYQKPIKPKKSVKNSQSPVKAKAIAPRNSGPNHESTLPTKEKKTNKEQEKINEEQEKINKEPQEEEVKDDGEKRVVTTVIEEIKKRRIEERLAKEKQANEEREAIVKESAERRAAEREEVIKQAKRLILYRKPMCRRINQALIASECLRELDAQLKFRETIRNSDKEEEKAYVRSLREDLAKFEEETKKKREEQLENQSRYANDLKKQVEELEAAIKAKQKRDFDAGKQDQININKYLTESKEHEMQQLLEKKQKLNKFFKDAIEEKKQLNLKLKHEDSFEDRAIEIYQRGKTSVNKTRKEVILKEKEEKERKANLAAERLCAMRFSRLEAEEKSYKKAVEEQEAEFEEKERLRKEREIRLQKERQEVQIEAVAAKSKLLQEDRDLKAWERIERFKRAEFYKEMEMEERKQAWNKKMEYGKSLKKSMSEKEAEREQDKIADEKAANMTEVIKRENQRVLNYAEEVLKESEGVRPLYPILKAVEECKIEMGLQQPKKREFELTTERKRKRIVPRVCNKFVPEDKVFYLK